MTSLTCEEAHRYAFRECNDSWSAAKVLADYMNKNFAGKKFLYITANYNWGHSTEAAFRSMTQTEDKTQHKGITTSFPNAPEEEFRRAIAFAKLANPDVLVLVEFGDDMVRSIRLATAQGLKSKMAIVVPNLTLTMAEAGGPKIMEGVIGALPWDWSVAFKYNYPKGIAFVENFSKKYNRAPCTSGASAYTILYEYKAAVERAGKFDAPAVIQALEGHSYTLLKDAQQWRSFDHQSMQTVYAVQCKPAAEVLKGRFKMDYFNILSSLPGDAAFRSHDEWLALRTQAGLPDQLEALAPR